MQAIIITCYKDKKHLQRLVKRFDNNFNIYIHIDKSSQEISIKDIENINKNVRVIQKYKISWGSLNHLLAIIDLLKIALEDKNDYFHIISGQDEAIKSNDYILNNFNKSDKIYMTVTNMNEMSKEIQNRYKKGCINSKLSTRNKINKLFNYLYALFRNKNCIGEFTEIYKGMIWCSMPNEVINYVITYISNNKQFMKDLQHCIIPEEFFFQTIIMNSKYKDNIVFDNLRFTDWTQRYGSCPAYLDENDYDDIKTSNCIFARKIDSIISKKLIDKLDKYN